ncbi:MAG: creatininase family protein, partial [Candidatus Riflebacteria bacterium]|nr:creatininase family protein [Candidatus Riflebacteria bacterium]
MKKQSARFLKTMNTVEIEKLLADDTPLFLPLGTLEAHGRHLPTGTDTILAEKIAEELSILLGGVVAPAVEYGLTKVLAQTSPASFFPEELYEGFVEKVIEAFRSQGFKTIIIVNGHGGNRDSLRKVVRRLARVRPTGLAVINWWLLSERFVEPVYGCRPGGHAAVEETALMLHYFPEMVVSKNYNPASDDYVPDEGIWLFPPPGEVLLDNPNQGQPDF